MPSYNNIPIKNIFYMLSYAYQVLREGEYKKIEGEEFDNIDDLFAEILYLGIRKQQRHGLWKTYVGKEDSLPLLKGKLNIYGTIRNVVAHKKELAVEYDEFSPNNILNQILKTSVALLLKSKQASGERKKHLRSLLPGFHEVDEIDPLLIRWNAIRINRNNRFYIMFFYICQFVIKRIIQSEQEGQHGVRDFLDDNMPRLFEKFVLNYYKAEHHEFSAKAESVKWSSEDAEQLDFLGEMDTDITLRFPNGQVLIIDAKYYSHSLAEHYGKLRFHQNNIYQIHTYVSEMDKAHTGKVSGMLLYARTNEPIAPDRGPFKMLENRYWVKSLNLNCDFKDIKSQLDSIPTLVA